MDYNQFNRLISQGEKATVDFKIECHAFASNQLKASNAELAKDIIAMCNAEARRLSPLLPARPERHWQSSD
jgi:hypothetical protein